MSSVPKHPTREGTAGQPSNDGVDRISNLPESIISHILSLLPTTEEAVATSVLSTNWKSRWKNIHNLIFRFGPIEGDTISASDSFAFFVNKILNSLNEQSIEKFSLRIYELCEVSDFSLWIAAAVSRNVKVFDFTNYSGIVIQLPCILFTCKTLQVLSLHGQVALNLPISISLPNLKTLILEGVIYQCDESVSLLISGCSSLETLTVSRYVNDNVKTFTISSPTLTNLTFYFDGGVPGPFFNDFDSKLEINAPQLRYLQLRDSLSKEFSVGNLCLLDEARIELYGKSCDHYSNSVVKLLQGFYNVKNLYFLGDAPSYKAIAHASVSTSFPRLSRLYLETTCSTFQLKFFERSQKLEFVTLVKISENPWREERASLGIHGTCWSKPEKVAVCLLSSLKTVTLERFEGLASEVAMVAYILKNAKVLTTMTIQPACYLHTKARMQLLQEVAKFPRGSEECELQFLLED